MVTQTMPYDPAEYLDTPEAQADFLSLALEGDDPAVIAEALRIITRARGMPTPASEVGPNREDSAGEDRNPLVTAVRTLHALGMKLVVTPA